MADQQPKKRFRPVIRVFVSSTFSDLKQERDALQQNVFPALEQLCLRSGFQFQAIDLRWGVSGESGLDHRTMRICFDELRRAQEISPQPNFLILLGDRYGWRPLPEEVSEDEFHRLQEAAKEVATTGQEQAPANLVEWYRKDENAIPHVYALQSRRRRSGKDYTEDRHWNEVQDVLWKIINRAWPPEQLELRFDEPVPADGSLPAIVRFQASATEQEIWHGAMRVPDAAQHVLAFFREIENVSEVTQLLQIKDYIDVTPSWKDGTPSWKVDDGCETAQKLLKAKLEGRLGKENVFRGATQLVLTHDKNGLPIVDVTMNHIPELCAEVERRLTEIIQDQIRQYWSNTAQDSPERATRELRIEQDEHKRFSRERGPEESFVGRQNELTTILEYVRNDSPWPLVVHGPSGCGKTALLARAAQEIATLPICAKHKPIVRYIGVTPRSSDIRALLSSFCQELRLRHPLEGELSADYGPLREELHEHFRAATQDQPLVLLLDALDQLSDADGGRLLSWVPVGPLPAHVKLVVSCLSDRPPGDLAGEPFEQLRRRRLSATNVLGLDALAYDEAWTLLFDRWLPAAGRTLSDAQRGAVKRQLASAASLQPLYLKLLFEEARLWRSFDSDLNLGDDVPALLGQLADRLGRAENHGPLLVGRALGYLAAALRGLTENELLEVLFADYDYKKELDRATIANRHALPANATRIPIALWARLRFDLTPYLTERAALGGNVLNFYHRQMAEWVQRRFASNDDDWQPHARLADYFGRQDTFDNVQAVNVRKVDELPFHQTRAAALPGLDATLGDLAFLQAKAAAGLAYDAVADFDRLDSQLFQPMGYNDPRRESRPKFRALAAAFSQELHTFRESPRVTAQQLYANLYGRAGFAGPAGSALQVFAGAIAYPDGGLWLRRFNVDPQSAASRSLRRTLSGHAGPVTALAVAPDDSAVASGGTDGTIQVWRPVDGASLAAFPAHDGGVVALAWVDVAMLISAGRDRAVSVWDWRSGHRVRTWPAHLGRVRALVVLPGRGAVATCGDDKIVRIWGLDGSERHVLSGHGERVFGLATDAAGRLIASAGEDRSLKIWSASDPSRLVVLRSHREAVRAVAVDGDAKWAVSAGDDATLHVWDLRSGGPPRVVPAHRRRVTCVAVGAGAPEAGEDDTSARHTRTSFAITGSDDAKLKMWDLTSAAEIRTLHGHAGGLNAVAVAASANWFASAGEDGTVRLWAVGSADKDEPTLGHVARVACLAHDAAAGLLATGSDDGTVKLWDLADGAFKLSLRGHQGPVTCLALTAGPRVISGSADRTLRVWDAATGQSLHLLGNALGGIGVSAKVGDRTPYGAVDARTVAAMEAAAKRVGHTSAVSCVAPFGPDRAVSGGRDGAVVLWDLASGRELATFAGNSGPVDSLVADAELGVVAAAGTAREVRLWTASRPDAPQVAIRHENSVTMLALSDTVLASASRDRTVGLRDLIARDNNFRRLIGHEDWVLAVAAHAGRQLVASGSRDATVRLWHTVTGRVVHVLRGHRGGVRFLGFDESGGTLLSAGDDDRVIAWDVERGRPVAEFHASGRIASAALVGRGRVGLGLHAGGLVLLEHSG